MDEARQLARFITGELPGEQFYKDFKGQYSDGFDVDRDFQKIGVVNQTTMLASETQGIADYLKQVMMDHYHTGPDRASERFADTRDTLCYATNDNQSAVHGLLQEEADLAIVIGGYNSSNTSHLVELCAEKYPTYFIKDEACLISGTQVRHFDLNDRRERETQDYLPTDRAAKILLTSGASCPDALVERVIARLAVITGNEGSLESVNEEWTTTTPVA